MEPLREVHLPWKEGTKENDINWKPRGQDTYGSTGGGPKCGPSNYIQTVPWYATTLTDIFISIIPMTVFVKIATLTNKYCYKDWVIPKTVKNAFNNQKKHQVLIHSDASAPGARHCATKGEKKYSISPGFILAWIAIFVINGAHFGSDKDSSCKLWREPPHGLYVLCVQNTMSRNAFEFMRQYIHFCDNNERKPRGHPGYDPLFKITWILNAILNGTQKVWVAGKKLAIDESMMKYMGRAISFVQYTKNKPIKHGIKEDFAC